MTGWMIIFAATSVITGALSSTVGIPAIIFVSALFGLLFVLALCTKAVRGIVC